ncbi:MAG: hypothetical protein M1817_000976 [Caeruleum heppii]|nr:MAG: hypothetical protein M1817_000976 [Caeruleum heppii]
MPDIDPAALSRTSSGPQTSSTPLAAVKSLSSGGGSTQKQPKVVSMAQRIDLEPIYTALKAAVGEHWLVYKDAISLFVLGHLNQKELAARIDSFITRDLSTEHLHNQLISAIYGNVTRDLPDHGVAGWVSANDKPTNVSKPVSGDAAEQRLKVDVKQLPARDRRRIKDVPDRTCQVDAHDSYASMLNEFHQAKQIKLPDMVPTSAGGLNKTNWDPEIRKRYAQPLASETGEFPDIETIQNRMTPMCYEEGLVGGAADGTTAFMNVATETFVKEALSGIFGRTRSNGPNYIQTAKYKRQVEREEDAWLHGELQKNANSLLPVEEVAAAQRPALGMTDFRLAVELGEMHLGHMPLTVARIMGSYLEGEFDEDEEYDGGAEEEDDEDRTVERPETAKRPMLQPASTALTNGVNGIHASSDTPSIDESDWGWEGGGMADREALGALLDECLAIGGH